MKFEKMPNDEVITTLRITKRVRRKLGLITNGNQTLEKAFEALLDKQLALIPDPIEA